jgi:uncharacterized membrane protein
MGEQGGAVVFVSSDDARAYGTAMAGLLGPGDPATTPPGDAVASAAPPAGLVVDNQSSPLDNSLAEPARAGAAGQGDRRSPVPRGGAMASSTPGQTNLGMDPKIAGLLCYVPCCVGLVFSVVVAVVEKQSRVLRFHAFQSLLFHGGGIAVLLVLSLLQVVLGVVGLGAVGMLVWLVQMVVGVALLAVLVILMIKANSGEEFALPVIGDMARKWL